MARARALAFLSLFNSILAVASRPQDCVAASLALRDMITYQIQISYSDSSKADNSVVFQLYNPVIAVDAQCAAYGPNLGVGDARNYTWYGCFMESLDTRISASFKYDFVVNEVTVNETWVCDTEDPSHP